MPSIQFTSHLRKVAPTGAASVDGETLFGALEQIFEHYPLARSYVLDDQDRLRKHVVIFVDGVRIQAGDDLTCPVKAESEIFVLQALSGG